MKAGVWVHFGSGHSHGSYRCDVEDRSGFCLTAVAVRRDRIRINNSSGRDRKL